VAVCCDKFVALKMSLTHVESLICALHICELYFPELNELNELCSILSSFGLVRTEPSKSPCLARVRAWKSQLGMTRSEPSHTEPSPTRLALPSLCRSMNIVKHPLLLLQRQFLSKLHSTQAQYKLLHVKSHHPIRSPEYFVIAEQ
jgi:hypothetical protein